jgi:hypothetical protein
VEDTNTRNDRMGTARERAVLLAFTRRRSKA